jgi:uncharacterized protein YutD
MKGWIVQLSQYERFHITFHGLYQTKEEAIEKSIEVLRELSYSDKFLEFIEKIKDTLSKYNFVVVDWNQIQLIEDGVGEVINAFEDEDYQDVEQIFIVRNKN